MKRINGDLIQLGLDGAFDVIIQSCNCFNTMGKGLALDIKKVFPEAYKADLDTKKGDKSKLGTYSYIIVYPPKSKKPLIVINAYTQYHYWPRFTCFDYKAIHDVFTLIAKDFPEMSIGYPMVGASNAGGDWDYIESIIEEDFKGLDHTLVVYSK